MRAFTRTALAALTLASSVNAATLTVNTFTDTAAGNPAGSGPGATGDLRWAMNTAGAGDFINFSCPTTTCTITLNGPLPIITKALNITASSYGKIIIDGGNQYRAFWVETGTVTLVNLWVRNVKAKGGNGGGVNVAISAGGGGGAGLGAGLFVNTSTAVVTVSNVLFDGATAIGGDGGPGSSDHGPGTNSLGGGGGLFGNGASGPNNTGGGGGGTLGHANGPTGGQGFSMTIGTGGNGGTFSAASGQFGGGGGGSISGTTHAGNGGFGAGGGGAAGANSSAGNGGPGGGGGGILGVNGVLGTGGSLGSGVTGGAGVGLVGGGGAAAGPAIFINAGSVTISGSYANGISATPGAGGGATADATPVFNYAGTVNGSTTTGPIAAPLPLVFSRYTLPNGTYGVAYPATSVTANFGTGTATLTSSTLPPGLAVTAGVVSGTPTSGGSYDVILTATDAQGRTVSQTYPVTIAPVTQLIAFANPGNQQFTPTITLNATATSGLAVIFSSLTPGVCTVSGNTLTPVSLGTCTVTAAQPGDNSYLPATTVTRSFNLTQGNQTITFINPGPRPYSPTGTIALVATSSSGLPVTVISLTSNVCTVSGNAVTTVAPGTCTLQADQAGNANYTAAPSVTRGFSIVRASQTITFTPPAAPTYSPSGTFTVSATASSGLPVTFTSSTPSVCTVSGTTVTMLAAGTCTLAANQVGNANYSAAPVVTQNITIGKASQSITFTAPSAQTYSPTGTFSVSATASSGLAVSFSSTTATVCTVSGTTVSLLSGGTCTIAADQLGDGNYSAAPKVTQSISIGRATQTLTFDAPPAQTYSPSGVFSVSATASSGLTVSFTSTTTSVCTVAGSMVTMLAAGTCTLVAEQAGDVSYDAAPSVTQSVTIGKAAQTLVFNNPGNQRFSVGGTFAVSATASSGLSVTFSSSTTSVCTVSGATVSMVTAGVCSITADQAGDANYASAPSVTQNITIGAAMQTITFTEPAAQTFSPGGTFSVSATASSGLAVTFTSQTPGVCTVSGATVSIVKAGTCTIAADQAGDGNYGSAATVTREVAIAKASQTLMFASPGDQPLSGGTVMVTATASSGLAVALASETPEVCTVADSTVTLVSAGSCTLVATQSGDDNTAAAAEARVTFAVTPKGSGCGCSGAGQEQRSMFAFVTLAVLALVRRRRGVIPG